MPKRCRREMDKKEQRKALWVQKSYWYRNKNKLIREYDVTSAEVHDSNVLLGVLTDSPTKEVYADSAYKSEENDLLLSASGYDNQIHERAYRNTPLTKKQEANNKKKSKIRARVEHVFGSITNEQDGMHIRVIGLARAAAKIGLTNLVYNLRRFETLNRLSATAN